MDIITIGIEQKTLGASFFIWTIGGGIQAAQYGEGIGMRNGHIGIYKTGGSKHRVFGNGGFVPYKIHLSHGASFLILNSYEHKPKGIDYRNRKKYYKGTNAFLLRLLIEEDEKMPLTIEASIGLYFGIRIGLNISELFDFILGFTTLDLMEDDLNENDQEDIKKINEFKEESEKRRNRDNSL